MTALPDEPEDRPRPARASERAGDEADSPEVEAQAADRVVVFSDAVVAIAITLLALGLRVPDLPNATVGQYLDVIRLGYPGGAHHPAWPQYAAFLVSFSVIAMHWSAHRRVSHPVYGVGVRDMGTGPRGRPVRPARPGPPRITMIRVTSWRAGAFLLARSA